LTSEFICHSEVKPYIISGDIPRQAIALTLEVGPYGALTRKVMAYPSTRLLKLGTSAWSNPSWVGVSYPAGTKPADYLVLYAEKYNCVEIDSTFYRIVSSSMIKKWYQDTPEGFLLAANVPQVITHEKVMLDCEQEMSGFLKSVSGLKEKLGPLLLQFPSFTKKAFEFPQDFYGRLSPFLAGLPKEYQWALEYRNQGRVEFYQI
jgi:uncharacterized protein YecE (DUF72 family)